MLTKETRFMKLTYRRYSFSSSLGTVDSSKRHVTYRVLRSQKHARSFSLIIL